MITATGIGSGLDVESIVTQLMALERRPLTALQQQKSQYDAQLSAYGQLRSALAAFQSAMDDLSAVSAFRVYAASSSDEEVIAASASSAAAVGSFGVEVVRLAERHKLASTELSSGTTIGGNPGDSVTIQVGSDAANQLTINLGGAKTLTEIRDAINDAAANPGVAAAVITGNGGMQKLVLTAESSGQDHALTISYGGSLGAGSLSFATINDIGGDLSRLDAEIAVDGYPITRPSNIIDDVIEGVTLNLVSAAPGVTNTVTVSRDLDTVQESVRTLADSYNNLRSAIKSLRAGRLATDNTLLSIERQLMGVVNTPSAAGGSYSYMSQIGVQIQKDGTMAVDSAELEAALQADFGGVAELFAANGQGYAQRFEQLADTWLGVDGLMEARTDGIKARIDDNEDRQALLERRLGTVETRYRAQFSALDSLLGQLNATSSYLTQQLSALQSNK